MQRLLTEQATGPLRADMDRCLDLLQQGSMVLPPANMAQQWVSTAQQQHLAVTGHQQQQS